MIYKVYGNCFVIYVTLKYEHYEEKMYLTCGAMKGLKWFPPRALISL